MYVVLSKTQDECSLNNRCFFDYGKAWKYKNETEENSGCEMYVIRVYMDDEIEEKVEKIKTLLSII